ncbi:hypothetical protein Efla_001350 [Eimeria flavescens]
MQRPQRWENLILGRVLENEVLPAPYSVHVEGWGLRGIERRVVRVLDCRNARAKGAEAQIETLRKQIEADRQLLVEARGEAEEDHRWRDQLQGTHRLMEAELETLRRHQQHWLQERSHHKETTHTLLAAEAEVSRMPILEQQIEELNAHKEALQQAELNEVKARSESSPFGIQPTRSEQGDWCTQS